MGTSPPQVITSKSKSAIIRHREYIGDVYSSILWDSQYVFPLNPGIVTTFPWLSQIASNYQEWRANGIIFEFKSTCGDAIASQNNSLGEVIISTQYNASSAPFTGKQAMEQEEFCTDIKPSCNAIHGIECMRSQTPLGTQYVRSGAINTATDSLQFYDLGNVTVATSGQQTGTGGNSGLPNDNMSYNLGEIWVSYEIELIKPRLNAASSNPNSALTGHVILAATASGSTALDIFSGPHSIGTNSNIKMTFPGSNQINFAANQFDNDDIYQIVYQLSAVGTVTTGHPTISFSNANPYNLYGGDSVYHLESPTGSSTGATALCNMLCFKVIDGTQPVIVQLSAASLYTAGNMTGGDFVVSQLVDGIL